VAEVLAALSLTTDLASGVPFEKGLRTCAVATAMTTDFLDNAATEGTSVWRSSCEVGRTVGPLLGLPSAVVTALDHVYERWDGCGIPGLAREDGLPLAARIVHVAEQAVLAHARAGLPGAVGGRPPGRRAPGPGPGPCVRR